MDKYSRAWVKWIFDPAGYYNAYAVTIGQTTYFSCASEEVDVKWHKHEDCHKRQWASEGFVKFLVKYLWYNVTKGYKNNPYEVEANAAENL